MHRRCVLLVILAGLVAPAVAAAAPTVLRNPSGIACQPQPDGTRFCQGSTAPAAPGGSAPVLAQDGTPLDVNVALPAPLAGHGDGNYPLIILGHGWGGQKQPFDSPEAPWFSSAHELARRGYAVLNITDRGWGGSCGSPQARLQNAQACARGWIHLMDARYEVADAQFLAGELADEGLIDPQRIGAVGESYGGGESLMLATLKDRVVTRDGTLAPWTSPARRLALRIAAATPTIPWSDLGASLLPNGHTLDYTITGPADDYTPAGVDKLSFVSGLFATGIAPAGPLGSGGWYTPPGIDQTADLTQWFAITSAGEPYEANPQYPFVIGQLRDYRSAYYMLQASAAPAAGKPVEAPAPMLLSSGLTDDLFPADETLRYYNLERALFPGDPIALTYMDYGHQRGQNKDADTSFLRGQVDAWIDHYVKGGAPDPGQAVTALTQTCPKTAASGGPFTAGSWVGLHPGVLVHDDAGPQTIYSAGGDPSIALTFDPIAGGGDACATASANPEPGIATYDLPAATGAGYTLLGAPLIAARLSITGAFAEIAGRLLDVGPDGRETLVARGVYRPGSDTSAPIYFELHPAAWRFAAGHRPRLELLGRDAPYARASNGQFQIAISALQLRLPTHETAGNGIVRFSAPLPPGATAAPGVPTTVAATARAKHRRAAHCRSSRPRRRHAGVGRPRHAAPSSGAGRRHRANVCRRRHVRRHPRHRHASVRRVG